MVGKAFIMYPYIFYKSLKKLNRQKNNKFSLDILEFLWAVSTTILKNFNIAVLFQINTTPWTANDNTKLAY